MPNSKKKATKKSEEIEEIKIKEDEVWLAS
jgi:hypothetical protein